MHRSLCSLALVAACQSPPAPPLRALTPEIVVAPGALDFGDRAIHLTSHETVVVTNGGRAPLELQLALEHDAEQGESVFALPVTAATVDPGGSAELLVDFSPATYLDYATTLVVTSNDEDDPEVRVPLSGTGVAAPVPDISLSRQVVDFGDGDGERTEIVTILNEGMEDLELGDVSRSGSGRFQMLTDPSQTRIAPGDQLPVVIAYAPEGDQGDDGALAFPSNDPDEPEVELLLLGNGGADYDYPVAVIDCPTATVDPPRFVDLHGADSYDPEGHEPLTFQWALTAVPSTDDGTPLSDGRLSNQVGETTSLWADAVGVYDVELVVENALGVRSAPDRCRVVAQPEEQVLVELTWSTTRADLDLHLALAGNPIFKVPGDASFCNQGADWGEVGEAADDPRLDLDDRAGLGPENISIDAPAEGQYDVRVHYFDDKGDDLVTATVRVYLEGELQPKFQASRNLERNQVWDVARINWPDATVGALTSDPYSSGRRRCYGN